MTDEMKTMLGAKLKQATARMAWFLKSEDARRINATRDLARSEPGVPVRPDDLDRDPMLFNCANGTIDLRTGRLREHRREDLLTRVSPVAFDEFATCEAWLRFLDAVFQSDKDLIVFVKRLLGRCLSGDVSEQVLPIFWGGGANGKSTLLNAALGVMGPDYSMKAPAELLMQSRGERHPCEIIQMFGMRLVAVSEASDGRRLNEALVKDMTGGERMRGRGMRQNFWEFDPTHKVILSTNHRPVIKGGDEGIWRRLRLVPFEVRFWDPAEPGSEGRPADLMQDKQLGEKLKAEASGILSWLVSGCLDWRRHGLTLPEKVKVATASYRSDEDVLSQFLGEHCIVSEMAGCRSKASDLYAAYGAWCERSGEEKASQTRFGTAMAEKGFKRVASNGKWYVGVTIKAGVGDPNDDENR